MSSASYQTLETPWPDNLDLNNQGVEVPGTRRPGQTGIYRNGVWGLIKLEDQQVVRTLPDVFNVGLNRSANKPFLGHRPVISKNPLKFADSYVWQTYTQIDQRRRNVGSALHKLFAEGTLGGGELETVGIWSQNRPEWQVVDFALQAYGKIGVSLYDTLGKDSVEFIINHAHLTIIFASSQHIPTLIALGPKVPMLKMIVSLDELSPETRNVLNQWGKNQGIDVKELLELEALGKLNKIDPVPTKPDQIATICYTSGTTNNPKGAVLTHRNLVASTISNLHGIVFNDDGLLLSYLPLAHIYERINELNVTLFGGAIGYFTGDPLRLLEDAVLLKPTYFPSVPRVLNRIYQAAMLAGQAPGLKGFLFRSALETKLKELHETGNNKHAFWDRIVFKKIQAVLGGRIKVLTCGSAPISKDVMDFLNIAFACDVVEGYGMTENCGTSTRTWPNDTSSGGTVGAPQPCNEYKLVDVPTMNYTSEDKPNPRGEICIKGDNCFVEYYKDEKNTREAIDEEGWLHTGDVGEIDSYGRIKIIDRIKNIMKLSQGEYVALEKIEGVYSTNGLVAQVYVHGESIRDHLVGIVVPDPIQFAALASRVTDSQITSENTTALAQASKNPRVVQAIFDALSVEADKAALKGFERIKRIYISLDPFSVDNGMLTPTLKLRRRDIITRYKDILNELYSDSPAPTKEASKL